MKRCREIDNVFGAVRTCFDHVLFSGFSWERILFLKSACVNMVMQIRVQIGDTRRAFFANPPWSVEDLKITFCVRFRRQDILLASLVYLLVYVSTHWVPIALLRQNKPFPLLYLGHAQIIRISHEWLLFQQFIWFSYSNNATFLFYMVSRRVSLLRQFLVKHFPLR